MMSLDLDEIDKLAKRHWLFSRNHWNIYSLKDDDYLEPNSPKEIKQKLLDHLSTQDIDLTAISRITLHTFPRIFGYQFNPVSFYYLEDVNANVIATVAEVGNTFHEKKIYLIDEIDNRGWYRLKTEKNFYVSPFSQVNDSFDFQIGPKDEKWSVNINDFDDEGLVLVSTIRGQKKSFSSLRLTWYLIRYPLLTLRIIFLIHWHALMMWLRKFPISNKRKTAEHQTAVLRPHKSLNPLDPKEHHE